MPTLIVVKDSKRITHRCAERCYNAISRPCRCVCQGTNHGLGLKKALIRTALFASQYPTDTQPSLFHSMTPEILDKALRLPNNIKPLVLLSLELTPKKEGG